MASRCDPLPFTSAPVGSIVESEVSITIATSKPRSSPMSARARPDTKMPQGEGGTGLASPAGSRRSGRASCCGSDGWISLAPAGATGNAGAAKSREGPSGAVLERVRERAEQRADRRDPDVRRRRRARTGLERAEQASAARRAAPGRRPSSRARPDARARARSAPRSRARCGRSAPPARPLRSREPSTRTRVPTAGVCAGVRLQHGHAGGPRIERVDEVRRRGAARRRRRGHPGGVSRACEVATSLLRGAGAELDARCARQLRALEDRGAADGRDAGAGFDAQEEDEATGLGLAGRDQARRASGGAGSSRGSGGGRGEPGRRRAARRSARRLRLGLFVFDPELEALALLGGALLRLRALLLDLDHQVLANLVGGFLARRATRTCFRLRRHSSSSRLRWTTRSCGIGASGAFGIQAHRDRARSRRRGVVGAGAHLELVRALLEREEAAPGPVGGQAGRERRACRWWRCVTTTSLMFAKSTVSMASASIPGSRTGVK